MPFVRWERFESVLTTRPRRFAGFNWQKKFNEARVLLDDTLKANPGSPDVLFLLGLVNLADSKFKEAEDAFQRRH